MSDEPTQAQPQGGEPVDIQLSPGETAPTQDTAPPPEPNLPDKFKGKSAEDIARSALEAERAMHAANTRAAQMERDIAQLRQAQDNWNRTQKEEHNRRLQELKENDPGAYAEYQAEVLRQEMRQQMAEEQQRTRQEMIANQVAAEYFARNPEMSTPTRRQLLSYCAGMVEQSAPGLSPQQIIQEADKMARDFLNQEVDQEITRRTKKEANLKAVQTETGGDQRVTAPKPDDDSPGDALAELRAMHNRAFQR